jgi:acyl-CoA synthetase (AMP-forming)/AMP-acid ligase II
VRAIAAALLERDLSPDRPVAILSGNDIEHALLGLAAMHIGIPYAPISVPYSLMSQDFKKLAAIIDILTPGLVKVLFYAGASLSQHVLDALQALAIETTGARIIFLSSSSPPVPRQWIRSDKHLPVTNNPTPN